MKLQDIIIWILFAISLLVVALFIFGDSLTIEQTLLVLIISYLFVINSKMGKVGTKLDMLEKRFNNLARDFVEHTKKKK